MKITRVCSHCNKKMNEGYCVDDGMEYYCSDQCLHENYSPEEWEEMCEPGGTSYWTQWDEEDQR